jgi:hypothetical protein
MPRNKLLRVRLSDREFAKLKTFAEATDRQISEVIRDYIKRLPKTAAESTTFENPSENGSHHVNGIGRISQASALN